MPADGVSPEMHGDILRYEEIIRVIKVCLRLTADGKLRPCLFSETEIDLRSAIRRSASDDEIERLLRLSIAVKPDGHRIGSRQNIPAGDIADALTADGEDLRSRSIDTVQKRPMSKIGG